MKRSLLAVWLAAGCLTAWLVAQAALRVCPHCAYEVPAEKPACEHCGKAMPPLPGAPAPAGAPAQTPPAATVTAPPAGGVPAAGATPTAAWDAKLVQQDIDLARDAMSKGDFWLATFYIRNAAALQSLVEPKILPPLAVIETIQKARAQASTRTRSCPMCKGSGKKVMLALTMKGQVVEQELAGQPCPGCNGTKVVQTVRTAEEMQKDWADAMRRYITLQRSRNLQTYRGLWLPPGAADNLAPRQVAALFQAAGSPCEACMGTGSPGCEDCQGLGWTVCSNENCRFGTALCEVCNGTGRSKTSTNSVNRVGRCTACGAIGHLPCPDCGGKGRIVCPTCEGKARSLCSKCKGLGEAPVCTRCDGLGVATCRRCDGTGQTKTGPCASCKGQGVTLCGSCEGTGRALKKR